ncbi:hypothetical protein T459_21272 [Capsicum annuum]|uniref:Uncharacterized protein n=1 Tax=Capsicum annuum TaxID=4072 RepID=A0A2G2YWK1_CAPAN|nr:hypothetical protein FXO37_08077 [Capsicum annuum]PHT73995.1 hypothetical protein T459_21272 [Capsicum annuum]
MFCLKIGAKEQSTLIDKTTKIEKSDSYLKAKKHLELMMKKRDEKSRELFAASQYHKKSRKKVKKLKAPRDATKEKVKKIKSKLSATEEEFTKCADISLATNDVKKKKKGFKDSLQDLVNYKLCVD